MLRVERVDGAEEDWYVNASYIGQTGSLLLLDEDDTTIAVYAPGQWVAAWTVEE
jgi:hypothetical protein